MGLGDINSPLFFPFLLFISFPKLSSTIHLLTYKSSSQILKISSFLGLSLPKSLVQNRYEYTAHILFSIFINFFLLNPLSSFGILLVHNLFFIFFSKFLPLIHKVQVLNPFLVIGRFALRMAERTCEFGVAHIPDETIWHECAPGENLYDQDVAIRSSTYLIFISFFKLPSLRLSFDPLLVDFFRLPGFTQDN